MTMMQNKGRDYVQNWCRNIGRPHNLSENHVALIASEVTGQTLTKPGTVALDSDAIDRVIGSLTPDAAKAIVAQVAAEARRRNPHGRPSCHYCGLPVGRNGRCEECV